MSKGQFAGMHGYVDLLANLRNEPATVSAFRHRHGLSYCGSYAFILGLHRLGRVHVCGWDIKTRVRPMAIFAFGKGTDAPCPGKTAAGRETKGGHLPKGKAPPTTLVALEYLLRELEAEPTTVPQLMEATGMHRGPVARAIARLMAHGFIRIGAWDRTSAGPAKPAYVYGPGRNAAKPAPQPRKVTNAKHWAKRRERMRFEAVSSAIAPARVLEAA